MIGLVGAEAEPWIDFGVHAGVDTLSTAVLAHGVLANVIRRRENVGQRFVSSGWGRERVSAVKEVVLCKAIFGRRPVLSTGLSELHSFQLYY